MTENLVVQLKTQVAKAKQVFWGWKKTPLEERMAILRSYACKIEQAEDLPLLISEEVGKPLWEARQEVQAMQAKVDISIQAMEERASTTQKNNLKIRHLPHGVLGVLAPYNFPGHLPNSHIVPALLAGNTVVFKPSEHAPRVGARIGELLLAAGLPEGVLEIIQGGPDIGWELATHPQLDGLLFTGGLKTGLALAEHYGKHPDKILALELGGNNPLIVEEVEDIQGAVLTTLHSAYLSSGQRCSSARRLILVDTPCAEPFLQALLLAIEKVRVGHYTDNPEPFMGPLITPEAASAVLDFQDTLVKMGGRSLVPIRPLTNRLLTPGLIDTSAITHPSDIECFGPLLQMKRAPTLAAAIHLANETRFGLTAALLSDLPESYEYARERIRAGLFNWNSPTTGASSSAPFGGVGLSGNGRPAAYYLCDTVAYPMVSKEIPKLAPTPTPGLTL